MEGKDKVAVLMSQTNYTLEEATQKLSQFDGHLENAIRDYLGIPLPRPAPVLNPHQEIFRQIRKKLDLKEYREKNPINMNEVFQNILESESRQKAKKE